jgi:hypothetical protein
VCHAFGWFAVCRRRSVQERFERHTDDGRRTASEAARCSPERTTERRGQTDRDLIVHEGLQSCTAIVVQSIAMGKPRLVMDPYTTGHL